MKNRDINDVELAIALICTGIIALMPVWYGLLALNLSPRAKEHCNKVHETLLPRIICASTHD